jgi:hypothetical protein
VSIVQGFRQAIVDHPALAQRNDPIGKSNSQIQLVQTYDGRETVLFANGLHELQRFFAGNGIEAGDRFIGKHDTRILNQAAGDADPLALTTGEIVDSLIGFIENFEAIQASESVFYFFSRQWQQGSQRRVFAKAADQDIFQHGKPANELMALKNHCR